MGHDELCDVSHYADKSYTRRVPPPTAFPTEATTTAAAGDYQHMHDDVARRAQLNAMKAAVANRPLHITRGHAMPEIDDNKRRASLHDDTVLSPEAAASLHAGKPDIYAKVKGQGAIVASKQALVDEFLLDGSAQLNGQTLSGYPLYGHRNAEERLDALRAALYEDGNSSSGRADDDRTWKPVYHPPSRLHLIATETTPLPPNAIENEVVVPESREQYWRRLARHYINQHATATAAAEDGRPKEQPEDPFFLVDLGRVVEQMALWRHCLPMVRPHFAIKCNPDPALIEVLAACGAGFDCASEAEINLILKGGKRGPMSLVQSPDDIIFANPCKQPGDLKAAAAAGVNYVTFDSVAELRKIAQYMPNAKAILRIKAHDAKAKCQFSVKFGAPLEEVESLLDTARSLNVEIYGVSFHVGSGNSDAAAYTTAVREAHTVFQLASQKGFNCTILDIGGGFPGLTPTEEEKRLTGALSFEEIAAELRPVLEELFPSPDTTIVAEPGRFFTTATHALVMNVFASRTLELSRDDMLLCRKNLAEVVRRQQEQQQQQQLNEGEHTARTLGEDIDSFFEDGLENEKEHQYYVNDGLYGTFNCIIFDHAAPTLLLLDDGDGADSGASDSGERSSTIPVDAAAMGPAGAHATAAEGDGDALLREALQRRRSAPPRPLRLTTIFGPTCDSLDCILKKKLFPEMRIGDWLLAPDVGSYTTAAGCAFNGFITRRREWICSVSV